MGALFRFGIFDQRKSWRADGRGKCGITARGLHSIRRRVQDPSLLSPLWNRGFDTRYIDRGGPTTVDHSASMNRLIYRGLASQDSDYLVPVR